MRVSPPSLLHPPARSGTEKQNIVPVGWKTPSLMQKLRVSIDQALKSTGFDLRTLVQNPKAIKEAIAQLELEQMALEKPVAVRKQQWHKKLTSPLTAFQKLHLWGGGARHAGTKDRKSRYSSNNARVAPQADDANEKHTPIESAHFMCNQQDRSPWHLALPKAKHVANTTLTWDHAMKVSTHQPPAQRAPRRNVSINQNPLLPAASTEKSSTPLTLRRSSCRAVPTLTEHAPRRIAPKLRQSSLTYRASIQPADKLSQNLSEETSVQTGQGASPSASGAQHLTSSFESETVSTNLLSSLLFSDDEADPIMPVACQSSTQKREFPSLSDSKLPTSVSSRILRSESGATVITGGGAKGARTLAASVRMSSATSAFSAAAQLDLLAERDIVSRMAAAMKKPAPARANSC